MISPREMQALCQRIAWAEETAGQLVCATKRRIRHGFCRVLLAELRCIRAELDRMHRAAWGGDA